MYMRWKESEGPGLRLLIVGQVLSEEATSSDNVSKRRKEMERGQSLSGDQAGAQEEGHSVHIAPRFVAHEQSISESYSRNGTPRPARVASLSSAVSFPNKRAGG